MMAALSSFMARVLWENASAALSAGREDAIHLAPNDANSFPPTPSKFVTLRFVFAFQLIEFRESKSLRAPGETISQSAASPDEDKTRETGINSRHTRSCRDRTKKTGRALARPVLKNLLKPADPDYIFPP
jgi:hypothetical protein